MTTLGLPVELPTSRNSYQHVETESDIKNPQWIPVLRKLESEYGPSQEKELSPYTGATFSPMPTYSGNSPQQAPKPSSIHSYSRSSVAPETVELEAVSLPPPVPLPPIPPIPPQTSRHMNFELPATRPTSRYLEKAHITGLSGDATVVSTDTETTGDMSRSESNAGTSTTTDDAASVQAQAPVKDETTIQAPPIPKEETPIQAPPIPKEETPIQAPPIPKEETPIQAPPIPNEETRSMYPRSTRSSYSSTKKYSIGPPTSKFNRKPAPALPSRITSLQYEATGPPPSLSSKNTPAHSRTSTPAASPRLEAAQPQPVNLKPSPSKASRKPPSLRLTPSNASFASHSSSGNATPPVARTPTRETQQPEHGLRKSSASAEAQQAKSDTKKPTSSLPPAIAVEEECRHSLVEKGELLPVTEKSEPANITKPQIARLAPQARPGPSSGISSFMTANDTVIFRRFDEVHVQLLLCLQDEITQLERELMKLESAIITRSDRDIERNRVIRELRKVVAEYGKPPNPSTSRAFQGNFLSRLLT
jgi:hypothetical protein